MDPNETLRNINAFLDRGDTGDEVDEWCADIFDWIDSGGYEPEWSKYPLATSYAKCRYVSWVDPG